MTGLTAAQPLFLAYRLSAWPRLRSLTRTTFFVEKTVSILSIRVISCVRHSSSASQAFFQGLVPANNNENFRVPHNCPFMRGMHWWSKDSPHKWPVTRKAFPCHDVTIELVHIAMQLLQRDGFYVTKCRYVPIHNTPSGIRLMADSRLVPSQWETSLQSNAVSHWLGTNLDSALDLVISRWPFCMTSSLQPKVVLNFLHLQKRRRQLVVSTVWQWISVWCQDICR